MLTVIKNWYKNLSKIKRTAIIASMIVAIVYTLIGTVWAINALLGLGPTIIILFTMFGWLAVFFNLELED